MTMQRLRISLVIKTIAVFLESNGESSPHPLPRNGECDVSSPKSIEETANATSLKPRIYLILLVDKLVMQPKQQFSS